MHGFPILWDVISKKIINDTEAAADMIVSLSSHASLIFALSQRLPMPNEGASLIPLLGLQMYNEDKFYETFSIMGRAVLCTSLYFAINWLREVVNWNVNLMSDICVKRLRQILEVESKFKKLRESVPGWDRLDLFQNALCKRDTVTVLTSFDFTKGVGDADWSQFHALKPKSLKSKTSPKGLSVPMREFRMSVFTLFNSIQRICTRNMDYLVWRYLLVDLNDKVVFKFGDKLARKDYRFHDMDIFSRTSDSTTYNEICHFLPGILILLEKAAEDIFKSVNYCLFKETIPSENDELLVVSECFLLGCELLIVLLSWKNNEKHRRLIEIMATTSVGQLSEDYTECTDQAYSYISSLSKCLWTTSSAYVYGRLLISMANICKIQRSFIGEFFEKVTSSNTWPDRIEHNHLEFVLQKQIEYAEDPILVLSSLLVEAFPALSTGAADILVRYPLLNRETFTVFFKVRSYLYRLSFQKWLFKWTKLKLTAAKLW